MTTFKALRRSTRLSIAVLLALLAVLAVAAAPAMAEFGLQRFAVSARNQNGTPDVQAGSHPYSVTTTFVLKLPKFGGDIKNLKVELPPGFVGDPNATPHCTYQVFVLSGRLGGHPHCPNETAVGVATIYITTNRLEVQGGGEVVTADDPIYNLVPPTGVAAEFAFMVAGETPVFLDTTVRTGTDYGLNTNVPNISQAVEVEANKVTLWGVPSSPAHNDLRGDCVSSGIGLDRGPIEQVGIGLREGEDELEGPNGARNSELPVESVGECPTQSPEIPLLTNPTSCGTPRTATMRVDSWEEPGNYSGARTQTASLPPLEGCEKLDFSPTVAVTPDGTRREYADGIDRGFARAAGIDGKPGWFGGVGCEEHDSDAAGGGDVERERIGWSAGLFDRTDRVYRDEGTRPVQGTGCADTAVRRKCSTRRTGATDVSQCVEGRERAASRRRCWKMNWQARCIWRRRRTSRDRRKTRSARSCRCISSLKNLSRGCLSRSRARSSRTRSPGR